MPERRSGMLKACLNGNRTPDEHPRLPVTARQIAADTVAVVAAGADMVHVHVKDADGSDTFAAEPLAALLQATRSVAAVPVGVTTGAWVAPSVSARLDALARWTLLPNFASVNWHEEGATAVAETLLTRGVGVEAGLWTEAALGEWLDWPQRDRCLRVLVELPDEADVDALVARADRMLAMLAESGTGMPIVLHGEGRSAWPILRHARRLGVGARIGLEDTLVLPDGTPAEDNAALVRAAIALA